MDPQQSSSTAAVDPDRISIQYFEKGGANPQREPIVVVPTDEDENGKCVTFSIKNEDHTLGNILRHIIMQNPDVEFCGYSVPHPSEAKIMLRIQCREKPAIEALRAGLDELKRVCDVLMNKFTSGIEAGLKYFVERTKVGKNLPIYTEYRNGGNTCFTIIKKVSGDPHSLCQDLAQHIQSAEIMKNNKRVDVIKKKWKVREELGHVWVDGSRTAIVRSFLESRGF